MSSLVMPEGKHKGKNLQEIRSQDPDYIVFLSGRDLSYIQKHKYKAFFERIPEIVREATNLSSSIPKTEPVKTPQTVVYPGGWRGW